MLYSLIRWLIILIVIASIIIVSKMSKKKKYIIIILIIVFFVSFIFVDIKFPIENYFINFKTPQKAFSYYNNGIILDVIEGSESALIIYKDDDSSGISIIPKSDDSWQINPFFSYDTVYKKKLYTKEIDCDVTIFQSKKTDDYYIEIDNWFTAQKVNISDNRGTNFLCFEESSAEITIKSYTFYAYVEDIDDNYTIQINDEIINILLGDTDYSNFISGKDYA